MKVFSVDSFKDDKVLFFAGVVIFLEELVENILSRDKVYSRDFILEYFIVGLDEDFKVVK